MEETRYSFSEAEYQAIMKKVEDCSAFERKVLAERDAALAWGEAMREALEHADGFLANKGHSESDPLARGLIRAALSTPAPAALDALRRKVRDEALEEAANRADALQAVYGNAFLRQATRNAAAAIRAMKEGEG